MKKVAIITVSYNGRDDTLEFLNSLKRLKNKNLETLVVVVDNGSSDNTVLEVSQKFPQVDLIQSGANLGYAGGFNKGLEYSLAWGADFFFLLNNDITVNSPNLLESLVKVAEEYRSVGIVSPKVYFAKGFEFFKERYQKRDLGKVIWYGGGEFDWDNVASHHFGIDEVDEGKYDQVKEVDFASGCCLLIKREVIEKVGFFDEQLFAYFEDNDFSQRVTQAGFKKFYDGQVSLFHKVSRTAGIGSPQADYFGTRNRLIFGMRYASTKTKLALLRQALKTLLVGRPPQRKGVWDFLLGKTGAPSEFVNSATNPVYPVKLSVVIVNYNTAELTRKLLKSIYQKDSGIAEQETEVILLDNGQVDSSENFIKNFPQVKYIQNRENTGFTRGYNRAIKYSRGEYVLLLNSDIEVLENGLSKITKAAERFRGQAVVGGKLYFPDMTDQDSCFNLPTIFGAIKEYFLGQEGAYFMFLPKGEEMTQVEGMVMACFLIPKKVINKVGFLDEGTFIFFEDIEYCRRLKRANISLYFCPTAHFIHHHGASSKKLKGDRAYQMLVKGSLYYHGRIYYALLYLVLWLGQKFGRVETPVAR